MSQMARNVLMECGDLGIEPRFIPHDRDGLFAHDFDRALTAAGVRIVKMPFQAPDVNAHAERWVLSVKVECLDHLVLFGLKNLRRTVSTYRDFHNGHRPHQGIGQRIPADLARELIASPVEMVTSQPRPLDVACTPFLGGLLKSYSWKAA